MAVVALLLTDGLMMNQAEGTLRNGTDQPGSAWSRLKVASWTSLTLWFGFGFLGTAFLSA